MKGESVRGAKQAVDGRADAARRVSEWVAGNLAIQGYHLDAEERSRLRVGLRFATGSCVPLVAAALLLESPVLLLALAGIAAVAGLSRWHPFDLLWNHGIRHVMSAPPVPPNPVRRRHAFKIGAALLLLVAALFEAGLSAVGLAMGGVLLAACVLATTVHFCVPSFLLDVSERWHASNQPSPGAPPCGRVDRTQMSARREQAPGTAQYE